MTLTLARSGNPITENRTFRPHVTFSDVEGTRTGRPTDYFDAYFDSWDEVIAIGLQLARLAEEQKHLESMVAGITNLDIDFTVKERTP